MLGEAPCVACRRKFFLHHVWRIDIVIAVEACVPDSVDTVLSHCTIPGQARRNVFRRYLALLLDAHQQAAKLSVIAQALQFFPERDCRTIALSIRATLGHCSHLVAIETAQPPAESEIAVDGVIVIQVPIEGEHIYEQSAHSALNLCTIANDEDGVKVVVRREALLDVGRVWKLPCVMNEGSAIVEPGCLDEHVLCLRAVGLDDRQDFSDVDEILMVDAIVKQRVGFRSCSELRFGQQSGTYDVNGHVLTGQGVPMPPCLLQINFIIPTPNQL